MPKLEDIQLPSDPRMRERAGAMLQCLRRRKLEGAPVHAFTMTRPDAEEQFREVLQCIAGEMGVDMADDRYGDPLAWLTSYAYNAGLKTGHRYHPSGKLRDDPGEHDRAEERVINAIFPRKKGT